MGGEERDHNCATPPPLVPTTQKHYSKQDIALLGGGVLLKYKVNFKIPQPVAVYITATTW